MALAVQGARPLLIERLSARSATLVRRFPQLADDRRAGAARHRSRRSGHRRGDAGTAVRRRPLARRAPAPTGARRLAAAARHPSPRPRRGRRGRAAARCRRSRDRGGGRGPIRANCWKGRSCSRPASTTCAVRRAPAAATIRRWGCASACPPPRPSTGWSAMRSSCTCSTAAMPGSAAGGRQREPVPGGAPLAPRRGRGSRGAPGSAGGRMPGPRRAPRPP
ncbi:hypothetical protein AB5I41_21585 [Sphingomonas sp. MMS24-JH45]